MKPQIQLFTPIKVGPMTMPNRITVAPMCMYRAKSGVAQIFHKIHYAGLAAGGIGMVTIESTAVRPDGRTTDADLGLWSEDCEAGLARLVSIIREYAPGVKVCIQLNHAGRRASTEPLTERPLGAFEGGWGTVAPSPIARGEGANRPRELDKAEIAEIVEAFAQAAARAVHAGVDAVLIHGANGFLIHEFLSAVSNKRIDEYGGAFEARMRFGLEVVEAVCREVAGRVAVGLRVPASDWTEDGIRPEEALRFAKAAKAHGVDFVDVSTGGLVADEEVPYGAGYQVPFAAEFKKELGIPVFVGGCINAPWQAETILVTGMADAIDVGRGVLDDPHWGWHAARKLNAKEVELPMQVALAYRRQ